MNYSMNLKNMTIRQIRSFVAVAESQGFAGAAQQLNTSQPALSHCIKQLELLLGNRLFNRTTRRVHLTPVGETFLPHARHLVAQFDSVMSGMEDVLAQRSGQAAIACLASIAFRLMPVVMAAMKKTYPGIGINIRDENNQGAIQCVLSGEVDFGIATLTRHHPDLHIAPLASDSFRAVCRADHPLAAKKLVRWRDIERYPLILMGEDTGIRYLLNPMLARRAANLTIVSEVSHLSTVNGLVEEGVGITLLAGLMLPRGDRRLLVHRPIEPPAVTRTISVIWRKGARISPAALAVIDITAQVLRDPQVVHRWPHVRWHAHEWNEKTLAGWAS